VFAEHGAGAGVDNVREQKKPEASLSPAPRTARGARTVQGKMFEMPHAAKRQSPASGAVLGGLIFYYAFCSSAHDGARSRHAGTPRPDRRSGLVPELPEVVG
jgi:hypothetical protein